MAWVLLLMAIGAEVTATVALRYADGLTRLGPSAVVVGGYALSFYLLSLVVQRLPVSVTYPVWAGLGTALVAVVGAAALGESMTWWKAASLVLVVAGVVGLSLSGGAHGGTPAP